VARSRGFANYDLSRNHRHALELPVENCDRVRVGKSFEIPFLNKPSSIAVIAALERGLSVRSVAHSVGVSTTTVQKVKAAHAGVIVEKGRDENIVLSQPESIGEQGF
jgi:hypothetical protein